MATAFNKKEENLDIKTYDFKKNISNVKKIFSLKSILFTLITFAISTLNILDVQPLAYVMIAVAIACNINMGFAFIATILSGIVFGMQTVSLVEYIVVYALMLLYKVIFYRKGTSKALTITALTVFTCIVHTVFGIFPSYSWQALYNSFKVILLVLAFCPVFISGAKMLFAIKKHYIFAKEEIIALEVLLVTIICILYPINIAGFVVSNILLLTLVLVVSWRNDWSFGVASGIILGIVYAIITGENTLIIFAAALSGFLAGILRSKSKILVALVCFLCNALLVWTYKSDTVLWISLSEVLIASGVMLALPKKATHTFQASDTSIGLASGYNNLLGPAINIEEQISSINNILTNMANITEIEQNGANAEVYDVIEKYIRDYIKSANIQESTFNIQDTVRKVVDILETNKKIPESIFPNEIKNKEKLIDGINEVYGNMKFMSVIRAKDKEKSEKAIEEYKMFSNLLRNIVKGKEERNEAQITTLKALRNVLTPTFNIYEDFYTDSPIPTYEFITDIITDIKTKKAKIQNAVSEVLNKKMVIKLVLNSSKTEKSKIKLVPSSKYVVSAVAKQVKKTDSEANGDSYLVTEQKNNNKIIAISDGVGSGKNAKNLSQAVINIVENMSRTGMDNKDIASMLNKILELKEPSYMSATLDMCVLNENTDTLDFIKQGATSSYIIFDGKITEVKNLKDTLGAVDNIMDSVVSQPVSLRNVYNNVK